MIDHIGINTTHLKECVAFYSAILAPLGYEKKSEYSTGAGFGSKDQTVFWINESKLATSNLHLCFSATNRAMVDLFYQEALKAGGKDNGAPGLRVAYHDNYYAAFIIDFEGNNIEAVCHAPS